MNILLSFFFKSRSIFVSSQWLVSSRETIRVSLPQRDSLRLSAFYHRSCVHTIAQYANDYYSENTIHYSILEIIVVQINGGLNANISGQNKANKIHHLRPCSMRQFGIFKCHQTSVKKFPQSSRRVHPYRYSEVLSQNFQAAASSVRSGLPHFLIFFLENLDMKIRTKERLWHWSAFDESSKRCSIHIFSLHNFSDSPLTSSPAFKTVANAFDANINLV